MKPFQGKPKWRLRAYLQWPLILSVILIFINIAVLYTDQQAGLVMSIGTCLLLLLSIGIYLYSGRRLKADVVNFAVDYTQIQKQLLYELALPYGLLDVSGRILWVNKAMGELLNKDKKKDIYVLFPDLKKIGLPSGDQKKGGRLCYGDRYFQAEMKVVPVPREFYGDGIVSPENEDGLIALYMFDETDNESIRRELLEQRLVAGFIYLDNYEEALQSVEEVRRSLLVALIDRKINKYISGFQGIVKPLEKDRYFFAIQQKHVDALKEDRFSLLEEVKTVNIGNEMAVTLSIGLGMNGQSYAENYEYARIAIDMALGRGGDQAVLKDGENISYFGGKSQQVEKNTRVKARVKAHALRELIGNCDRVMAMGHRIGDIDSFGAAMGIYRAAVTLNKKAHVVLNEVTSSVGPTKARFTPENGYPEDLFLNSEQALKLADEGTTLLVVVDVNRPCITECPELLDRVHNVVVLDHHRQTREVIENAVLSYVEPYASSTCELVAEILQYIAEGVKIRQPEADAMYAGITIDTDNFLNKTGVRTFEAAAFLRRNGADITRVRKLFRDQMEDYKAKAETVRDAEVFEGAYALGICPSDGLESPTVVGAQAANELLDIVGIKASFVLTWYRDAVYISARSIDEVNVQIIMEKLGGGGHMTIAGAQLSCTMEEAVQTLKDTVKQMVEKGEI